MNTVMECLPLRVVLFELTAMLSFLLLSSHWLAAAPLRQVLLTQPWQGRPCGFFRSWIPGLPQIALTLSGGPATQHLNGVSEQHVTKYLKA